MRPRYIIPTLVLLLGISHTISAQREETLFNRSGLHLTGLWGAFSYNHSFYEGDGYFVRGGYFGMEFNDELLIGWGGQKFKDRVVLDGKDVGFTLRYNGLLLGYTRNTYRAIHPRVSVLLASGRGDDLDGQQDGIFVLQPAGGVELNLFTWMKVGAEGGYRIVTNSDLPQLENGDLSGPFLQFDLRFGINW